MIGLGERLREERERKGLTQEQLAEKVGCGASYITHIERGRRIPTLGLVMAIAEELGVSLAYLVGEQPQPRTVDAEIEDLPPEMRKVVFSTVRSLAHELRSLGARSHTQNETATPAEQGGGGGGQQNGRDGRI